jgi:hypothetical protein
MYFRNATQATGSWTQITQTAALSITTNATGATLGSVNNTAFRFWVVAFNNGGSRLSLAYSTHRPHRVVSRSWKAFWLAQQPISGSATSGGVIYTPNGTTIATKAFLIHGYVEYNSTGLVTAGIYATAPNFVQTIAAGVRRPCEPVQLARTETSTLATGSTTMPLVGQNTPTNAQGDQYMTLAITPSSAANPLRVTVQGYFGNNNATGIPTSMCLYEDTGACIVGVGVQVGSSAAAGQPATLQIQKMLIPNLAVSTTFKMRAGGSTAATTSFNGVNGTGGGVSNSYMQIEEIMGANDNEKFGLPVSPKAA